MKLQSTSFVKRTKQNKAKLKQNAPRLFLATRLTIVTYWRIFSFPEERGNTQGSAVVVLWRKLPVERIRMCILPMESGLHSVGDPWDVLWNFWPWVNIKSMKICILVEASQYTLTLNRRKEQVLAKICYCSFDEWNCVFSWHSGTFPEKKKKHCGKLFFKGMCNDFLSPEQ